MVVGSHELEFWYSRVKIFPIIPRITKDTYPDKVIKAFHKANTPARIIKRSKTRDFFVAEDKQIIGAIGLAGKEVKSMCVNSRFFGKKIGTKLLKYIEKLARSRHYKTLFVHSSIYAIEFYKSNGFKKLKRIKNKCFAVEYIDVLMKKDLHNS